MSKYQEQADRGTELVGAYRGGDLSRRAFSERAGIAVSTLDYYLRRENERLRKKQRLLPVVVTVKPEESKVAEIAVVLGNGRRVELRRGFEPELLLRVLSVLERA
jgi:lambda repressor-like predicted transcriptional regulator